MSLLHISPSPKRSSVKIGLKLLANMISMEKSSRSRTYRIRLEADRRQQSLSTDIPNFNLLLLHQAKHGSLFSSPLLCAVDFNLKFKLYISSSYESGFCYSNNDAKLIKKMLFKLCISIKHFHNPREKRRCFREGKTS